MANGADKPLIFISYSHFDQEAKDFAHRHLGMLEQLGDIEVWEDSQIVVGDDWFQAIEAKLHRSSVAVLLISTDFLRSEFCMKQEVPVLLERRKREGMMIAPILLRPCAWQIVPWLAAIQMQPSGNTALLALNTIRQEQELSEAVIAIHGFLEKQKAKAENGSDRFEIQVKANTEFDAPLAVDLTRLPTSGFDVVGRDKELQFLNEAFDGDTLNVVSLRAWGGVGKSTLVNKWCEYLAADNYRGARRVFAWSFYSQGTNERVTSADAFIDEALRFFGDDDPTAGSPWAKGERLAALVGSNKALLILDGMEPLQDDHQGIKDPALARLAECLAETNAGLCLITTREPVKEFSDFPETTREVDLEQLSIEAGRALLRIKGLRAADDLLKQLSEAFGNHALALNLLASFLGLAKRPVEDALNIPDLPDVTVDAGKHPRRVMAAFAEHFGEGPELDLLHVMGLFDRRADVGCIAALRAPVVPGLTEGLSVLDEIGWRDLLSKLRCFGLLAMEGHQAADDLDAHPLVREHFGAQLRIISEDAWKAGHKRLFEHLQTVPKKRQPDTLTEMAPLFQAVHHGCQAGRHQETLDELYDKRIRREGEVYLIRKLGALGADLGLLASFFDVPFRQPSANLTASDHAWLFTFVAFDLRSLGRLGEAVTPMQAGLEMAVEHENWNQAAIGADNLSEIHLALGDLTAAQVSGEAAVEYAERSDSVSRRITNLSALAEARLQAGALAAARALFEKVEEMQAEDQSDYTQRCAFQGPRYCDLLLTLGWAEVVYDRARKTLKWLTINSRPPLLNFALEHLSLGRAAQALDRQGEAGPHFVVAVDGLREAGRIDHIPRGLLARASFFREVEEYEKSRKDLAETMRLAIRCGMRLHECDAHLEYARLALAEGNSDAACIHFKSADELVNACGYHRRDPDIAELKERLNLSSY